MEYHKNIELSGTCAADGTLTLTATEAFWGYVEKINMVYDDGDTGADIVFSNIGSASNTPVMTVTNLGVADLTWQPRALGNKSTDGTALTNVGEKIFVDGRMKAVITAGGISKNFKFIVTITR